MTKFFDLEDRSAVQANDYVDKLCVCYCDCMLEPGVEHTEFCRIHACRSVTEERPKAGDGLFD